MVQEGFETGLPSVVEAYRSGHFLSAAAQTFSINFLLGSLMVITLPACVFPLAGILVGFLRAFLWGLVLAPTTPQFGLVMIPHGLTLLLEGQAYILAVFAACRLGQVLLWPEGLGLTSHWRAYLAGLRETVLVYILVAIVLLVSALWEACARFPLWSVRPARVVLALGFLTILGLACVVQRKALQLHGGFQKCIGELVYRLLG